jgi:RNA polymerase sigma-70 factor (ECF subfamily)
MAVTDQPASGSAVAQFTTTRWGVVLPEGDAASPQVDVALAELCHTYWYLVYAFVHRKGHDPHDAQDLTQGFFARLLEKNCVTQGDRGQG